MRFVKTSWSYSICSVNHNVTLTRPDPEKKRINENSFTELQYDMSYAGILPLTRPDWREI